MQQSELPEGWAWVKFEDIVQNYDGKRIPLKSDDRKKRQGEYSYYGASGVIDYIDDYIFDGEYLLISEDGANLVARSTPIAFIAKGQFWVNNHAHIVKTKGNIPLEYLSYFFNSLDLLPFITGSAQPKLTQSNLNNIEISLPPLPEQHRIVTAIEALFARLDATNERLDRVPGIMKTFRQAVLAAACDGRLTEDWRLNNTSPKTLSQKDSAIPEDWSISKIKDVFEYWGGATPSTSNPSYWDGDIPWISSKDMKTWKISNGQDFITSLALENTNLRICPVNSVLVVVRSGILLHTLPIAITESEVVINQDLKAFYNQDHDLNNWLAIFLKGKSPDILYKNRKDGTTVQSIKFDDLKNMDLLIPPKGEQREIVRRLDSLFAFADSIEVKVAVAREKTERLRQSILAKAFSGELVPTEAELARQEGRNYESAEVLLERIKREGISGKK